MEELRTDTRHYRGLWLNEARMGMILLGNLPEGHGVEGFSQAEGHDHSSPFYDQQDIMMQAFEELT